jgi:hypothetical protein
MDMSPPKKQHESNNTTQIEEHPTNWASPKIKIATLHTFKKQNKENTSKPHFASSFPISSTIKSFVVFYFWQLMVPFQQERGKTHSRRRAKKEALESQDAAEELTREKR